MKNVIPGITILPTCRFLHPTAKCVDLGFKGEASCSDRTDGGKVAACSWAGDLHWQVSRVEELKAIQSLPFFSRGDKDGNWLRILSGRFSGSNPQL